MTLSKGLHWLNFELLTEKYLLVRTSKTVHAQGTSRIKRIFGTEQERKGEVLLKKKGKNEKGKGMICVL
jgi:hypothetical protein